MREWRTTENKQTVEKKVGGGQKTDGISHSLSCATSEASMLISTVSRCSLIANQINRNTQLGETAGTQQTCGLNHAAA